MLTEQEILHKLYQYCALQERSPAEISRKVIKLGGDSDLVKGVLNHLFRENLLNEDRFAALFVQGKMNTRRWGPLKIANALRNHGISETAISAALHNILQDDYREMILRELKKKWRSLKEQDAKSKTAKVIRFGQQRGYSYHDMMTVLKHPDFSD